MPTKFILVVIVLILVSSIHAPSVLAKDFSFQYKKSELITKSGTENIFNRILRLSEEVCDYQFEPPYAVKSHNMYQRCMRRTVKELIIDLSHPQLTRLYETKLISKDTLRESDTQNNSSAQRR